MKSPILAKLGGHRSAYKNEEYKDLTAEYLCAE